jgi:lipopolysaccharide/colanic/teichoic acid biosynthesis glycosyltransferase
MSKFFSTVIGKQDQFPKNLDILDEENFSLLVRRERERADRSRQALSLTIFNLSAKTNAEIKDFSQRIKDMIRSIDGIGWMVDRRLGVLLPSTNYDGACVFAARAAGDKVVYTIYAYPEQWDPEYGKNDKESFIASSKGCDSDGQDAFVIATPIWKRSLDIVGSIFGLAILWPLFLLVAIFIKIVSPGPAFFTQQRVGQGGKLFKFIKFRTMKYNNDQGTHQEHIIMRIRSGESLEKLDSRDTRIIFGGKILRRLCIDELPQLINILKGQMSLVGPRPCLPYEAQELKMWHTHRFDSVPGLTGLWQVSGKNKLTFTQMIRLDIAYATNMSFANDVLIILRTFPTILTMVVESAQNKASKGLHTINNAVSKKFSHSNDSHIDIEVSPSSMTSLTRIG